MKPLTAEKAMKKIAGILTRNLTATNKITAITEVVMLYEAQMINQNETVKLN